MEIVLATRNTDKIDEIRRIMGEPFNLLSIVDFPEIGEIIEDGDTLQENAFKKAVVTYKSTGLPSLADDTGLEVDYLKGAPGVRSNRFAGERATYYQNCQKLLRSLEGIEWKKRTARFRTVVAFIDDKGDLSVEGVCEGIIHTEFHGDRGFGYDPLFLIPEKQKTFAQMSSDEKNAISHRGIAFRKMAVELKKRHDLN